MAINNYGTNSEKTVKSEFVGFNLVPDDVIKIDTMADYLFLKKLIGKNSRAEAVRWGLSLSFMTVRKLMEEDLGITEQPNQI